MPECEIIDLIDKDDNVIGITDVHTAHHYKQPHRVSVVYLFSADRRLYLQEHLSSTNRLDHSAGGHVGQGESYESAAARELEEELLITPPLIFIGTYRPLYSNYNHRFGIFFAEEPRNWQFQETPEVRRVILLSINQIYQETHTNPDKFTRGFLNTFHFLTRHNEIIRRLL